MPKLIWTSGHGESAEMTFKTHWENIYSTKMPEQVGWYKPHLQTSLAMINRTGVGNEANIIDVGGGASTLVDDLLDTGFEHITVLDLASAALDRARSRLAERSAKVRWIEGDIANVDLSPGYYDVWHDRAVFHFLMATESRKRYVDQIRRALKAGGHSIIATFAPEAPPKCSGLNVMRYSPEQLHRELGKDFVLHEHSKERHITPGGVKQMYLYCRFQNVAVFPIL